MIKQRLWSMYGSEAYTAEWDGTVYGGGKISQRFWEYFIAVEMLELTPDSIVLDIGGGKGFFANLVAPFVKKVIILDENQDSSAEKLPNIERIRKNATHDSLSEVLSREITHIACISVFEHVPEVIREQMIRDINDVFTGGTFVTTFEFHPSICYFEHQLTTRTMSRLFSGFTHYYPLRIESSPLRSENAYGKATTLFHRRKRQYIGMWYPLAVHFRRVI